MNVWNDMLGNQILVSAVVGWTVAQVLKTLIDCALNKSFNAERLVGSGGMPSSHSATVCALTTAAVLEYGAGPLNLPYPLFWPWSSCMMPSECAERRENRQSF